MIWEWCLIGTIAGVLAREYLSGRRNLSAFEGATFLAILLLMIVVVIGRTC